MLNVVYASGSKEFSNAASDKVSAYSDAPYKVYQKVGYPNQPETWSLLYSAAAGELYQSSAITNAGYLRIDAGPAQVLYSVSGSALGVFDLKKQGDVTAKTTSATLTAAEVLAGIITVNQGGGAASAQQLPTAANLDLALPSAIANDAFDFSVINISTVAAEDASVTTNTGWTLVGNMDVASNAAAGDKSAGRFRARKTAAGAWTLYRLS